MPNSPKPESKPFRYLLIGGDPFRHHCNRGTKTFLGIGIVGRANTTEELKKLIDEKFDECGGLLCQIDTLTGEQVEV